MITIRTVHINAASLSLARSLAGADYARADTKTDSHAHAVFVGTLHARLTLTLMTVLQTRKAKSYDCGGDNLQSYHSGEIHAVKNASCKDS